MRIQRLWRSSQFHFATQGAIPCTTIVWVYALRERYWQQPMVPHCSGYVLKLERSWTQPRKPMKVIWELKIGSQISPCTYPKPHIYLVPQIQRRKSINTFGWMHQCRGYHMHFVGTEGYHSWYVSCVSFRHSCLWVCASESLEFVLFGAGERQAMVLATAGVDKKVKLWEAPKAQSL